MHLRHTHWMQSLIAIPRQRLEDVTTTSSRSEQTTLDDFAPEPYIENECDAHKVQDNGQDNFSPAVRAMMNKWVGVEPISHRSQQKLMHVVCRIYSKSISKDEEEPDVPKVRLDEGFSKHC